jgi:hypothetical protein
MPYTWSYILNIAGQFFRAVWVLRAPLIVSALALVVLSQPGQITEIYITLAQDYKNQWLGIVLAIVSLMALGLVLWSIARELTQIDVEARREVARSTAEGAALRNLPGIFGLVPFIGVLWGLKLAWDNIRDYCRLGSDLDPLEPLSRIQRAPAQQTLQDIESLKETAAPMMNEISIPPGVIEALKEACRLSNDLVNAIIATAAAGLVVLVYILWRANTRIARFEEKSVNIFNPRMRWLFVFLTFILVALFAAQSLPPRLTFGIDFTAIPRAVGTIFLVNLFLIFAIFFVSTLTRAYDKYGIPLVSLVLISAIVWSYLNWNDNHRIRTLNLEKRPEAAASAAPNALMPLTRSFEAWLEARPKELRERFWLNKRPYPVYVVAAQGGGLYSANLAALTLARLYDRCPRLRHHVFAISGVSGGSVGAGLISALLEASDAGDTMRCDFDLGGAEAGPIEASVKTILAKDYLAPLMASALFPDMMQRLIPYPVGIFDRARAFEASLERSFEVSDLAARDPKSRNPMTLGFLRHWSADKAAPMLVLNTTLVETGEQIVIAPIGKPSDEQGVLFNPDYRSIYPDLIGERRDIRLSTAMSLSARFPLIMPAGRLRNGKSSVRLVDGGYFENSGVATAQAIISDLISNRATSPQASVAAVGDGTGLTASLSPEAEDLIEFRLIILSEDYTPPELSEGLNELMTPLRTLLRTRSKRGQEAIRRATKSLIEPYIIKLSHDHFHMSLGWHFATPTQRLIEAQVGLPTQCIGRERRLVLDGMLQNQVARNEVKPETASLISLLGNNACNLCYILKETRGEDPYDMKDNPCGTAARR